MTFVVFSWQFLPENNAEGYCTTRFVSALASRGHKVHVVTHANNGPVPDTVYEQLVSPNVTITRVKTKKAWGIWNRICSRLYLDCYLTINYRACIRTLKRVLKAESSPILISRSLPISSALVALSCRKYARMWVAHFSDPIPFGLMGENDYGFKRKIAPLNRVFDKLIAHRVCEIIQKADAISVTCAEVMPFFKERYGKVFAENERKFFVVPHVGDPVLQADSPKWYFHGKVVISHVGYLSPERYVVSVLKELGRLSEEGQGFTFLLLGLVDPYAVRWLKNSSACLEYVKSEDPGEATNVINSSSVSLVVDSRTTFPYSPFLPSKFVYQLFLDKPIVVYTLPGSAMSRLAQLFPEAGIWCANPLVEGELQKAVKQALGAQNRQFDRSGIRCLFSGESVAENFVKNVMKMKVPNATWNDR